MNDVEERLQQRLRTAVPTFDPVPLAAVAASVRRRRRIAGAATAAGVALLAGAAVTVPQLALGDSRPGAGDLGAGSSVRPATPVGSPPTLGPPPCPPGQAGSTIVDYVDFVQVGGREYLAGVRGGYPTVPRSALGARVTVVRCTLATIQPDPDYRARDGDAAFLPAGTPLYAVKGYPATARLAAATKDGYRLYLRYP